MAQIVTGSSIPQILVSDTTKSDRVGGLAWNGGLAVSRSLLDSFVGDVRRVHGPGGFFARTWEMG